MIADIFHYGFLLRGLEAGVIVAVIAPLIGIFLVLRRYALIADTLAHVSLAGIAVGLLCGISPVFTALGASVAASLGIERLRSSKKVYGESALALFLSGSLAVAVVLLSVAHGSTANVLNYLFGSIVTVTATDVHVIFFVAVMSGVVLRMFYKELLYVSFDEEAAQVSGVPTHAVNMVLIILSALVVALAIPIVGVLLISALMVIPVVTALQLRQSFTRTLVCAEIMSLFSVVAGILFSYYFNVATGGTIVLIMLFLFALVFLSKRL